MDQPLYRITVRLHLYITYYRRKTINYEVYIISTVLVFFIVNGLINSNVRAFHLEALQFRTRVFVPYCACWLDETGDSQKIRYRLDFDWF